jgi:hypothetical protein
MPFGLNRSEESFRNGTPIDYTPTPVAQPGNKVTWQTPAPNHFGNPVTWTPDPTHFGVGVDWETPDPSEFGNILSGV